MKIEAKLFELLTAFFILVGIAYAVFTVMSRTGVEWIGVTCMALSAGLTLIMGTYFRFVARRLDTRPEDYDEAEIADGSGELGFFSPGSFWPLVIALSVGVTAIGLALFAAWLIVFGILCILTAVAGLVFEYHVGPEKH